MPAVHDLRIEHPERVLVGHGRDLGHHGVAEPLESGDVALGLGRLAAPGREQEQERGPVRAGQEPAHHRELIVRAISS
jgi:hypothetical protein